MEHTYQHGAGQPEELPSTNSTPIPQHISLTKAAALIGCNPETLRRWAADDENDCPTATKLGGRGLYFRLDEINDWLARRHAAGDRDAQSA